MNQKQKVDVIVVGLGEILWDLLPEEKRLGGAPANFAYFANKFGYRGHIVSKIGNDEWGEEILAELKRKWIISDYIAIDRSYPTSTVTVELDKLGIPNYTIHENVAWDHLALNEKTIALAKRADVVCYGSLASRHPEAATAIEHFLTSTNEDCLKVCDINIRKNFYTIDRIKVLLEHANVLKLNEEELTLIATLFNIQGSETDFLTCLTERFHLSLVILTKGEKGSRLFTPDGDDEFSGSELESLADTVGAGDSFTATVVAGLLENQSLTSINRKANQVAAYVCSQKGAMPDIPPDLVQY